MTSFCRRISHLQPAFAGGEKASLDFFWSFDRLAFAYVFNRKVIEPLEGLVDDMTDFANDPYQPWSGMITKMMITDAQQALHILQTATRRELVQREKQPLWGRRCQRNHDMRNVLLRRCWYRTVWKTAMT